MLGEGQKAPDFELKDKDGKVHKLSEIGSDFTIVYFYPKDNTPGCTIEANDFSDKLDEFRKANARVIGISGGDEESKRKFCEKHNLKLILLSDPEFKVCSDYGVYGKKKFMGKEFMGIRRTTFVLDRSKKIVKIYENVKAKGHAEEVLGLVKGLKHK